AADSGDVDERHAVLSAQRRGNRVVFVQFGRDDGRIAPLPQRERGDAPVRDGQHHHPAGVVARQLDGAAQQVVELPLVVRRAALAVLVVDADQQRYEVVLAQRRRGDVHRGGEFVGGPAGGRQSAREL